MKLADLALHKNVKYNDTLNPKVWDGEKLRPEIRQKLIEIGESFFEFLEVDEKGLVDYLMVGSCANYNWSKYSDIDLHILMDYHVVGQSCNEELVEDFLKAKKEVWKEKFDITVLGIPVEISPQERDATLDSSAIYSILENSWVKKPVKKVPEIDEDRYSKKVEEMKTKIDKILSNKNATADEVQKVREEIKKLRKAGLAKGGEFGADNLVFKALRNQGYIEKLETMKNDKTSEELSL